MKYEMNMAKIWLRRYEMKVKLTKFLSGTEKF